MSESLGSDLSRTIKIRLALVSFVVQAVFLYSSELFNTIASNKLDLMQLGFVDRLPYLFKPIVAGLFVFAYVLQLFIMFRTLSPLFTYLDKGQNYRQARLAAIKMPWRIMLIQTGFWLAGTVVYSFIQNSGSSGGIPFWYNIALKLGTGLMGSIYNCVLANVILIKAKRILAIEDIHSGESDLFTRNKALIITVASTILISSHLVYYSYYSSHSTQSLFNSQITILLWSLYFIVLSVGLSLISRYEYNTQIRELLEHIGILLSSDTKDIAKRIRILYFDEVGEFAVLFNRFLDRFQKLLEQIDSSATVLVTSVQELSTTTKEVTSTYNMQAAAVKEVVSTMEDSNTITQSVGRSISEVTRIAMRTKEHVDSGTGIVQQTTNKMNEIRHKNTDTISGIRSLTDKIRAIWDIVDIINAIVEQTRIIAFNAALEASTAGEAGRNFRVVASEIKRLADSTSHSTAEIQARITEIQKAANNLIVVSEEGTERIRQGHELSDHLHEVFSEILSSAEISVSSSESIEHSIRQQMNAFEQILVTMKEISGGIDNLVLTQQQTAKTAESLSSMAAKLKTQSGDQSSTSRGEEA